MGRLLVDSAHHVSRVGEHDLSHFKTIGVAGGRILRVIFWSSKMGATDIVFFSPIPKMQLKQMSQFGPPAQSGTSSSETNVHVVRVPNRRHRRSVEARSHPTATTS